MLPITEELIHNVDNYIHLAMSIWTIYILVLLIYIDWDSISHKTRSLMHITTGFSVIIILAALIFRIVITIILEYGSCKYIM